MKLKITNEYNGRKTYKLGQLNKLGEGMTTDDVVIGEFVFEPRCKTLVKDGKTMILADAVLKGGNLDTVLPQCLEDTESYGKQLSLDLSSFVRHIVPKEHELTNTRKVSNGYTMSDIVVEGFRNKTYAFHYTPIIRDGKPDFMFMMSTIRKVTEQQKILLGALLSESNIAKEDTDETKLIYSGKVKVKGTDDTITEKRISDILPYYMLILAGQNKLDTLEFEGE